MATLPELDMGDPGLARVGDLVLKLGPTEWALLKCLHVANGRPVSKDALYRGLYAGVRKPPNDQIIIHVHLCHLRKRLKGSGIKIVNRWGVGWFLRQTDAKAST